MSCSGKMNITGATALDTLNKPPVDTVCRTEDCVHKYKHIAPPGSMDENLQKSENSTEAPCNKGTDGSTTAFREGVDETTCNAVSQNTFAASSDCEALDIESSSAASNNWCVGAEIIQVSTCQGPMWTETTLHLTNSLNTRECEEGHCPRTMEVGSSDWTNTYYSCYDKSGKTDETACDVKTCNAEVPAPVINIPVVNGSIVTPCNGRCALQDPVTVRPDSNEVPDTHKMVAVHAWQLTEQPGMEVSDSSTKNTEQKDQLTNSTCTASMFETAESGTFGWEMETL